MSEANPTAPVQEERPIPGPPGPAWRRFLAARKDLLKFLAEHVDAYGGLVRLGENRSYIAAHPDYVKHVLQDNHFNYVKGERFRRALGPLIGEGLIAADGEEWRRQRRRTQPYLLKREFPSYVETVTPTVMALCDRFEALARTNTPINVNEEMDHLAVAANVRMMCGTEADADVTSLVAAFVETGHSLDPTAGFNPIRLPTFIPTPKRIRFNRAIKGVNRVIYRLIENRRRNPNPPQDLLSGLIFDRDDQSGGDRRLRDEIMTMLHAGFETVSDQIVWNLLALANHPDAAAKVREESDRVLAGRIPGLDDLGKLPYLHMVTQEVMRLYPTAWGFYRTALADDHINGYRIPAGVMVFIVPYVTHRLPSIWNDPEVFQPERFLPEEVAQRHRFAFVPFGAGPRHCIGGGVASLLIAMTIAAIVQRFDVDLVPGQQVRPVPRISLKPEPALWVRLRPRSSR